MFEPLHAVLESSEKTALREFLYQLHQGDKRYYLRNEVLLAFHQFCNGHTAQKSSQGNELDCNQLELLNHLIQKIQEVIFENHTACIIVRPGIASEEAYWLFEDGTAEQTAPKELLELRDRLVNHYHPDEGDLLEIDVQSFYDYSPLIRDPKNIGRGVEFLNRYLSSKLFQYSQQWQQVLFQFLQLHSHQGMQLLLNQRVESPTHLSAQVKRALEFLKRYQPDESYSKFRFDLQSLGFEPGWGNTVGRVCESLELLDELLDSPDPKALESFLSRIPMIFRIVLVSVHGWFGQEGVLGRPDTGGQVVYVLDQARSLEKQLKEDMELAGLTPDEALPKVIILSRLIPNSDGTRCDQPREKVHGTDNVWIVRVPFRDFNPNLSQNWISRFEIWSFLETFAVDSEKVLLAEFQGRPDLILGNYTDGNLVAFLLSRRLKVTNGIIAHALEKSKYLFSNLYWQEMEDQYHFSLQFTADLIAMNAADFVISSTYQEIVGTAETRGQYESYRTFTMPDLYHVMHGVQLASPKFNVVPPGVNESYFFPYTKGSDRHAGEIERLTELLFTRQEPDSIVGQLDDPSKPPIFSMARLDRIKNLTGLVEAFGQSPELQARCNLIIIAGKTRTEETSDAEEADEIVKMHNLIQQHNLWGKIRWLGVRLSKTDSGEVYRIIADHHGVFVQPALFEAFGLTVLEAMISGLPTFATEFGGPLEIIHNGSNGFYINPTQPQQMADVMLDFFSKCEQQPDLWQQVSERAIDRVYSTYTWRIHTSKLLSLARIYGFWDYTSQDNREDLLRYMETLFQLLFKPRAKALLEQQRYR
ncbi:MULTISPECIES: sucrose synthase [unclassified Leptolyngbya]|uniref:sucrose synthase n=1 Tax=unclassified Leptolyngbya TaxID=2650499 RepID=UPI001687746F|nr:MULTISPECIES: sucrose synthase [unclassified Leptolyngbya]MBD1909294.1 sucrose synthase [Leptolyngbya sp. FACHB-8]MBD2153524.1 sucrose synthase [Leptolyngbya sp. FACHB-16]